MQYLTHPVAQSRYRFKWSLATARVELSMSRNQAWLLSLALVGVGLFGCTDSGTDTPVAPRQEEQVSTQSSGVTAQAKQVPTAESKRAFLLAQEASEHAGRRDYVGALSKLEAAIAIRGDVPEYSMMRCMLSERVSNQPQLDCYANVVLAYMAGGAPCESNLNCVFAASMASLPDALRYRTRFLASPRSPEDQAIAEGLLGDFSRNAVLHSILP